MGRVRQTVHRLISLAVLGGLGAGIWFGVHSEAFGRAIGKREDTRIVLDQVRPEYASATVEEGYTFIVPDNPSTVRVVSTVQIDVASRIAKEDVATANTGKDASQGGVSVPESPLQPVDRRVWTLDAVFTAGPTETDPWEREASVGPSTSGTYFDPYLVPVMNDVIGLELASLPWRNPDAPPEAVGGQTPLVPQIVPQGLPAEVTDQRRWTFDLATFRSLSPVAYAKTPFRTLDPTTQADVTMGFDADGVLQYLLVTVDPLKAEPNDNGTQLFSYEWKVVDLSATPLTIDIPTNVVEAADTDAAATTG